MLTNLVRASGGAGAHEVPLSEIEFHDIRMLPLFLPDDRWIRAVAHYYEDLTGLLETVRKGLQAPDEFFVPDLWDVSTKLPAHESERVRDAWSLGHDLASFAGYQRAAVPRPFTRNGVGGTLYSR